MRSRVQRLLLTWAAASLVMAACLNYLGNNLLREAVERELAQHLTMTLDESLFSTAQHQSSDV